MLTALEIVVASVGQGISQLTGKYLFGDIASGRLFYINIAVIPKGKTPIMELPISINGAAYTLKRAL